MAGPSTTTVTVGRISNSGNAIAQQEVDGKTVHAPASAEIGDTLEVKLVERSGYFEATLVDRADQVQPRGPSVSPDTSEIGQDLLDPGRNKSHSYSVGKTIAEESEGQELRSWISDRKM